AVKFDKKTGQTTFSVGGFSANDRDSALALFKQLGKSKTAETVGRISRANDQNDHGLMLWLDAANITRQTQAGPLQGIRDYLGGFSLLKQVTIGEGRLGEKGRFYVNAELKQADWMSLIPKASSPSLQVVGEPTVVFQLALPTADQFKRYFLLSEDGETTYSNLEAKSTEVIGLPLSDVFLAIGPRVAIINDDAGSAMAIDIRDQDKFKTLVDGLVEAGLSMKPHSTHGAEIHYFAWQPPPSDDDAIGVLVGDEIEGALRRMSSVELYWLQHDDTLYMSDIPQPLMDRAAAVKSNALSWFDKPNRADNVVAQLAVKTNKVARNSYYNNIRMLNLVALILDTKLDLFSLPTATDFKLPATGEWALQFRTEENTLYGEIIYDQSLLDFMYSSGGGGIYTVAIAGIVAAIAIPAYHEYETRVKVINTLATGAELKVAVAESYVIDGRFPNQEKANEIVDRNLVNFYSEFIDELEIEPDTGVISIYLNEKVGTYGWDSDYGFIRLTPRSDSPQSPIEWVCSSDLDDDYLPVSCRYSDGY
ncbi:MAG: hypothetical protein HKM24_04290, partial [Gammaproteobacteria bacterium]|nr:hypothetical protein [Gammaproteobacteria bacterium]